MDPFDLNVREMLTDDDVSMLLEGKEIVDKENQASIFA